MKQNNIYTILCSFLLVLFSTSLMVSTLHSHNHIEWHHPKKHTDTGHCLTIDSTVCPICAYLFDGEPGSAIDAEHLFIDFEILDQQISNWLADNYTPILSGRSPPFSV